MNMDDMTWTCHVCGKERLDRYISVHQRKRTATNTGVTVVENIRYCSDDPSCREGALTKTFLP